jgi:HEPN domain-containing protein
MKNDNLSEARRWLAQSKRDLDDAHYSAQGERHNLACFLAQQAAEKALKAFLFSKGAENVWGHSVADLCADAGDFDGEFLELKKTAASLDKYYIPTRYPNGLPGGIPAEAFIKEDSEHALKTVKLTIETVEKKIHRGV